MYRIVQICVRKHLVEVNTTCNARVSHAAWQGKVYSLSGDNPNYEKYSTACRVGDLVNGIGGYNCGHRIAVTTEGAPSVFGDPLEGTGYTQAEARAAVAKQRKIENEIRKAKREMEVLKLNGLDTADVNKRIRRHQGALREHIKANSQILHRQPARESIYNKAREKVGELGTVHLEAVQKRRIERVRTGEATGYAAARGEWESRALDDYANVVKPAKQNRHIPGTREYAAKVKQANAKGYAAPSRIIVSSEGAERLIRENAGKGQPIIIKGKWVGRERVMTDSLIGYVIGKDGIERPTRGFIIHYGKSDAHIVPMPDEGCLYNEA